jgi:hypothetical protein
MLTAAALAAHAAAGSLPVVDWGAGGGVDWASGYIIGHGSSSYVKPGDGAGGPSRSAALHRARLAAANDIYRTCLGITIQEKLRVRDYLRDDPELRAALRRSVKETSPWAVRLESNDMVRVVVRYPLGGPGLSGLLGRIKGWYGEERWHSTTSVPEENGVDGDATGIVLVVGAEDFSPSLRPRILDSEGTPLVAFEISGREALERPAYIPYYTSLAPALEDPSIGENPLIVRAGEVRGTDIFTPSGLGWERSTGTIGRKVFEEVRIVIVRE